MDGWIGKARKNSETEAVEKVQAVLSNRWAGC
jgi:hypothetical protein